MSPPSKPAKSRKLPPALDCTDIELSTTLHMRSLRSPSVEREAASAHTLRVTDHPYVSSMYFSEVPSRHTGTENNHSWYPMLEAFTLQQAPKRMPLSWLVWQGEGPIFHAVRTFLLYSNAAARA